MTYLGNFTPGKSVFTKFTTIAASTGAPTTLAGTPALSVYKDDSDTQSTSGVTLTADFDLRTGFNHVEIDTSADGTFYSAGSDFVIVITTGTVGGTSVVGYCVGQFSLSNRAELRPTVADRTLDVTATGAAGIDWGNVENPTTAVNLSATNIDTDQVVASVTNDVGITQAGADKVFGTSGAAMAELGAVPSATPNPRAAIMLPFMELRNKLTTTASAKTVFNDAGAAIASKALSDDGATYTEAEMA